MKTTYLRLVCLFMTSCLLLGCKPKATKKTDAGTSVSTPNAKPPKANPATVVSKPVSTDNSSDANENSDSTPTPIPANKLCGNASFNLEATTIKAAKELEGIMYNREPSAKADCSGIYHRVLGEFKKVCPEAKTPAFDKARDTRSLAAWYKKNGHLKIVRNPAAEADLIQPGAVMFYGYGKRRNHYDFQNMNMDTLTLRGTGINHIAIVTSVKRLDGELISYELFHGRTDDKPSAVTKSYKVTSWDKTWPMYGNAFEPWLAVSSSPFGK